MVSLLQTNMLFQTVMQIIKLLHKRVMSVMLDVYKRQVVDDLYVQKILEGFIKRTEYSDLMYVDMDLLDFSVFRVRKIYDRKNKRDDVVFSKAKINWKDELSIIDSIMDSRFKAFLATELSIKEILNYWSNFVLNRVLFSEDPNIVDILRSYCTIQNLSLIHI